MKINAHFSGIAGILLVFNKYKIPQQDMVAQAIANLKKTDWHVYLW